MNEMDKCGAECETYSMTYGKCFYEEEIRADERRKFAEWLINSKYHGICNDGFMYGVSDLNFKFNISSIDEILAEYEKENEE